MERYLQNNLLAPSKEEAAPGLATGGRTSFRGATSSGGPDDAIRSHVDDVVAAAARNAIRLHLATCVGAGVGSAAVAAGTSVIVEAAV